MRISVDARSVYQEPFLRGVGKALLELYRNLARLRPDWTFHMHHQDWNGRDPFSDTANVAPPARRQRGSLPRLAAFLASAVSSVVRATCSTATGRSPRGSRSPA